MKQFSLGLFFSILSSVSSATASGEADSFRKSSESFLIVLRFPAGEPPEERLISLREGLLPPVKGWVPYLDGNESSGHFCGLDTLDLQLGLNGDDVPSILAGQARRCHVLAREVGFRNLTVYSDVTVPGGALSPRDFIRK